MEINSEIVIHAPPQKVWEILADFKKYPEWNPFIKSIIGTVAVGSQIHVHIEPPGGKGMTFKPKVLVFEKQKELSWLGNFLFPGLFDGEHQLKLTANQDGSTTFTQNEKFNGILVPLFKRMLKVNTLNGFNEMNKKLKERCE